MVGDIEGEAVGAVVGVAVVGTAVLGVAVGTAVVGIAVVGVADGAAVVGTAVVGVTDGAAVVGMAVVGCDVGKFKHESNTSEGKDTSSTVVKQEGAHVNKGLLDVLNVFRVVILHRLAGTVPIRYITYSRYHIIIYRYTKNQKD